MGRYIRKTKWYNGKKYEATGKTELEALTKLADKISAAKRGEETIGGNMTVDAWFQEWMTTYKEPKGLEKATLDAIRGRYRLHIAPYVGKKRLKDIRDVHLQKALNELAGQSHSLVYKVYGLMQDLFSRARMSRLIPWDPSESLEVPASTEGKRRALTDAEREVLLQAADQVGHGLWFRTLLCTGMRPGESAALLWSSVDFAHNEIHVTAARETMTRTAKGPKTAAGVRDIPIHAELRPLLLAAKGEPFAYVFPNAAGRMADASTMIRWFNAILKTAREAAPGVIGDGLSAYCLRHTFASDLQKAGVPINVARELMGHSSIQTTANVYTHTDSSVLHHGIALLDGSETPQKSSVHGGNRGGNG